MYDIGVKYNIKLLIRYYYYYCYYHLLYSFTYIGHVLCYCGIKYLHIIMIYDFCFIAKVCAVFVYNSIIVFRVLLFSMTAVLYLYIRVHQHQIESNESLIMWACALCRIFLIATGPVRHIL